MYAKFGNIACNFTDNNFTENDETNRFKNPNN